VIDVEFLELSVTLVVGMMGVLEHFLADIVIDEGGKNCGMEMNCGFKGC
jgi:hypothetical protein